MCFVAAKQNLNQRRTLLLFSINLYMDKDQRLNGSFLFGTLRGEHGRF